jgi:membrane protease YdiL (CAAX protease family)
VKSQSQTPPIETLARPKHGNWRLVPIAWGGTLAVSQAPYQALAEMLGFGSLAAAWLWLAAALLVVLVASVWRPARPLRPYFTMMFAIVALAGVGLPILGRWAVTDRVLGLTDQVALKAMFFMLAVGMAAFLVRGLRLTPRAAFVGTGDLRAGSTLRLPGTRRPLPWTVLGPAATAVIAVAFTTVMWTEGAFPAGSLGRLLSAAPLILLAASFNAFGEEVVYRAGPLAMLHRVVGPGQAVWLTAVWFGLGHYAGSIPNGVEGVLGSALLGLLLGKAMIDSKGLAWPLVIHITLDVIIFASIAAAT